jgi:transcription antitermination factor NusG
MLSTAIIDEIKRRALEIQATLEQRDGPYGAEIVPGVDATWHLVRTKPSEESRAATHLTERGFGVYLPMLRTFSVRRNRKIINSQLFFPGYVFLWVWDVKHHWRRIKSCTGVHNVVCIAERPIIVPPSIIDQCQALEVWQDKTLDYGLPQGQETAPKKAKGGWRRRPKHLQQQNEPAKSLVTISTRGWQADAVSFDSTVRIGALERALGLAS